MGIFICQKQSVRCRLERVAAARAAVEYLRKIKENITFSTPAVTYKQGAHLRERDSVWESPPECVSYEKKKIRRTHPHRGGAGWLLLPLAWPIIILLDVTPQQNLNKSWKELQKGARTQGPSLVFATRLLLLLPLWQVIHQNTEPPHWMDGWIFLADATDTFLATCSCKWSRLVFSLVPGGVLVAPHWFCTAALFKGRRLGEKESLSRKICGCQAAAEAITIDGFCDVSNDATFLELFVVCWIFASISWLVSAWVVELLVAEKKLFAFF